MRYIFGLLTFLVCWQLTAQDTLFQINDVANFQIDPLGQIVYQDEAGRLFRKDLAADTTYVFDNNLLGEISTVDVSNPFGPLVYFENFDLVLLLDRTLNEVGRLDYRSSNVISSSKAVARNFDDKIWLFDAGAFRLKLLDANGEVKKESDDLRSLLGIYKAPSQLFINANRLYAYFPEEGLAVFTNFGQFLGWEQKGLNVPRLNFDLRRGIGWRTTTTYQLLLNDKSVRSYPLPDWIKKDPKDVIQPQQQGWWLLKQKKLFYLK